MGGAGEIVETYCLWWGEGGRSHPLAVGILSTEEQLSAQGRRCKVQVASCKLKTCENFPVCAKFTVTAFRTGVTRRWLMAG